MESDGSMVSAQGGASPQSVSMNASEDPESTRTSGEVGDRVCSDQDNEGVRSGNWGFKRDDSFCARWVETQPSGGAGFWDDLLNPFFACYPHEGRL